MNNNISNNSIIMSNVILGNNITIEDNVFVDYGVIIKDNVYIKKGTYIGANCILGEYLYDFFRNYINKSHPLTIGSNSVIRSNCIIYGDTSIGDYFQTGHNVTIRENNLLNNNVRIGTNSDIQHHCTIGAYTSIHSNVFVGEETIIEDFVWIFPHVVITNDPTPPSNDLSPVTIKKYASICARSILLPGITVNENALVCAGALVTKDVPSNTAVAGIPAIVIKPTTDIINRFTNKAAYPWMKNFSRGMPWEDIPFDDWLNSI